MTIAHSTTHLRLVEPPDLRGILDFLTNSAKSDNTKRSYANAWKRFCTFCESRGEIADGASAQVVGEFIASLYLDGRSVSMMRSVASGLRYRFAMNDEWTPAHSECVRQAIDGAATNRALAGQLLHTQAAALGKRECTHVIRAGKRAVLKAKTAYAKSDIWTDLAIVSVMRDGMLRRSEASALDWEHIKRDPDGSAEGTIVRSKTDQHGLGEKFYISRTSMELLDNIGRTQEGPVFVSRHGLRADPRTICRRIQRATRRAGLEGAFSGHSPRVGMTQDLVQAGYSTTDLQLAGRWDGHEMPARYSRMLAVKQNAVARWHQSVETQRRGWRERDAKRREG